MVIDIGNLLGFNNTGFFFYVKPRRLIVIGHWAKQWGDALVSYYGMSKQQAIYFTAHAEADLVQHDDRTGHGPLNRMILQRILERGLTARKLGYDPKYCALTMVDLHALMENHALETPYPS